MSIDNTHSRHAQRKYTCKQRLHSRNRLDGIERVFHPPTQIEPSGEVLRGSANCDHDAWTSSYFNLLVAFLDFVNHFHVESILVVVQNYVVDRCIKDVANCWVSLSIDFSYDFLQTQRHLYLISDFNCRVFNN